MPQHKAKRVSNYELFFDLVVVLAFRQLTAAVHLDHIGLSEILFFLTTCLVLLNIWNYEAFYYNKLGDSRRIDIYSVFTLMLWMGNLALTFNFDSVDLRQNPLHIMLFHAFLILCYATIGVQYYLKGRIHGFTKDMNYSIGMLIAFIIPLLPVALGLVSFGIWVPLLSLLPFVLPLMFPSRESDALINIPHAIERNQLLTILTFGESVIAAIHSFPLTKTPVEGALIFFGMATLFMTYMSQTFLNMDHHKKNMAAPLFYAHAVIITSLLFFTVSLEFLADHHHQDLGVAFFISSILFFYIGVLSTAFYNKSHYRFDKAIIGKFIFWLILASIAFYLSREHIMVMGAILIALNYILLMVMFRFRKKRREMNNIPHPNPKLNLRDFR